jgi:hypothetical protein
MNELIEVVKAIGSLALDQLIPTLNAGFYLVIGAMLYHYGATRGNN